MTGSFSTGLSGLSANANYLSVIGNNLANINTVGYKASTVSFADLVSQNVGGRGINPMQVGLGVVTGSISPVFSQGAVEATRESANVAIQGNGFFVVRSDEGNAYTRAGNFTFDAGGKMVTPDGWRVQGYTQVDPLTGGIVTTGGLTDIVVPTGVLRAPVATTNIRGEINLDAGAAVGGGVDYTVPFKVFDALGGTHDVTIAFEKTGPGAWTYTATVPQADVNGAAGVFTLGTGVLAFDGAGQLTAPAADVVLTGPPTWANGAAGNDIIFDITPPPGAKPTLTSYAGKSQIVNPDQDGAAAGSAGDITIGLDGTILVKFGPEEVAVGQIALASFNNPKGLTKLGANRYGQGPSAGLPNIGVPDSAGRGTLTGGAIEQSNVDIATEFTQMILAQRGYQANSRTITVSDEVLVETLQLKR